MTVLGQRVGKAHGVKREEKRNEAMAGIVPELPVERPYMPMCGREVLVRLALLPGPAADAVGRIGKGMVGVAGWEVGEAGAKAGAKGGKPMPGGIGVGEGAYILLSHDSGTITG